MTDVAVPSYMYMSCCTACVWQKAVVIGPLICYTPHFQEQKGEQKLSITQRLLKMTERIFLQEQVKKREHKLKEFDNEREEEPVRERREKRSLWNRIRGRRGDTPGQIIGETPATGY